MRAIVMLVLLLVAGPAFSHPSEPPPPDTRPQYVKDWIARTATRLALYPEPWELVWPDAWNSLAKDRDPPNSTAEIHRAISEAARTAYGALLFQKLALEEEDRRAKKSCAELILKDPTAGPLCLAPCEGACPAASTPAELAASRRQWRLAEIEKKLVKLRELEGSSDGRLQWKREQGEKVD